MARAMEGSNVSKLVFLVVVIIGVVVVGMSGEVEGALSCSTVVSDLTPCLNYVAGSAAQPTQGCCNGVKALNAAAKTTADRRSACNCIKSTAASTKANYNKVGKLPGLCGVKLGYTITPSINCNTVP
ncbi:non-specific lipid-transfer protein [Cryptomeria japonica]|uniref:non-specific lipid-transfer protein n=1 Tax=Cryptomeria japonica TaxID=3369 RepID=UPI0025AD3075|nr:non-specific lipid-transfer protein [Cryptomeria japonica]